jgi:UDP-3-O-[3-hydroxymyristoyl] glucosamine N-acyltransferase
MSYTLDILARLTGCELIGDPAHQISGVENLEAALSHEAAFFENPRYERQLEKTQAGVIIIPKTIKPIPGKNFLISSNPSLSFQSVIELFITPPKSGFDGIHPTAVVHPGAIIGPDTRIGPHSIIDQGAVIGAQCVIETGVFIGAQTKVGSNCHFYSNVVVRENCQIGSRVILQPGVVIGSCGFGYFTDRQGKHIPLKQLGKVIIEDDVEIGANTTIDRARFKATIIKKGTKIDNLVQIGHQVEIGEDNLIVSQVGIAGSTKTGKNVVMGGQSGVAGHLHLADGVMLAAKTGVSKSLLQPGPYAGAPAIPLKEQHIQIMHMRNLEKHYQRLKELEAKVEALEKSLLSN